MTAAEQYPNWFSKTAEPNFEQHLLPLAGQPDLRFLQLGAYTGDATEWLMNNIPTSSDSILQDVDTWRGSDEEAHETIDFEKVYGLYLSRIRERDTVHHYRKTTFDFLIQHRSNNTILSM